MNWITGKIVSGYGVASGQREGCTFPGGTIRLQRPFFMEKDIDLSRYFPGTLNVDLAPIAWKPDPQHAIFDDCLQWFPGILEHFILSPVEARINGHVHAGLWYYPHPDTKPDHMQKESVVELLLPWIDGLTVGKTVAVKLVQRKQGAC